MAGKNLINFAPVVQISNTAGEIRGLQQRYNFDGTKINNGKGNLWFFGINSTDGEHYYKLNNWYDSLTTINATAWTLITSGGFDNETASYDIAQTPNGKIWIIRAGGISGVSNIYMTFYNGSTWASWVKVNTTATMNQCSISVIGEEIVIVYGNSANGTVYYKKVSQGSTLAQIFSATESTLVTLSGADSYLNYFLRLLSSKSLVFYYTLKTGTINDIYYRISPAVLEIPDLAGFATSSQSLIHANTEGGDGYLIELTDKRWMFGFKVKNATVSSYKLSSDGGGTWGTITDIPSSNQISWLFEDYLNRVWYSDDANAQVSGWTPNNIQTTQWS